MQIRKDQEKTIYARFIISVGITFVACLFGIFLIVSITNRKLIYEQAKTQARSIFNSIVMTRKWNARYGGVYVEKKAGMVSNPYLDHPDIVTVDGKIYTQKNPALMAREISEYAEQEGLFKFHITSLNLLNPDNTPDAFETRALHLFEKGENELFANEQKGKSTYFRYMAPLYVEESCLQCHAKQGYKTGEIRGGISVTFDVKDIRNIQKTNTYITILLGFISTSVLLGLFIFFTFKLIRRISEARQQIERMAITDELTGLYNRRHFMTRFTEEFERARRLGKDLGCIMIDIDFFKNINDRYGHLVGDEILREASGLINKHTRRYDIMGRYGGEEFLIVLPDTTFQDTLSLAERIRTSIKGYPFGNQELAQAITVTISLGIASLMDTDSSIDTIIKRADEGLYKAKSSGRDSAAWI